MRIAQLKRQKGPPRGRWACYRDALKQHNSSLIGFDVLHIHNAPDGYAVQMIREALASRVRRAIVLDIDDHMPLHIACGEVDPVREYEMRVCDELLRELAEKHHIPVIVATPAMQADWPGSVVIRNFPMQEQIDAIELWCGAPRPRIDATVYAGSTHDDTRHHRHPANWLQRPDAMLTGLNRVDLVHALAMFKRGLIPFRRTALTDTFEPHKLFEYMIAGCEVVVPGRLRGCLAAIEEFRDKPVPSFESQLPLLMEVYDAARKRQGVDAAL